jgi:WD40 repeat protein/serine/threonine protein kinase
MLESDFLVHEQLGGGAFGEVYRAHDVALGVDRAIKILRRDAPGTGSTQFDLARQRFELEAQLGAQLEQRRAARCVRVYGFRKEADSLYLIMEYMPGGSLADRLKRGTLSVEETIGLAHNAALGLSELHALKAVHRDIKPGNILFDAEGRACIADFGLAQLPRGMSLGSLGSAGELRLQPGTPEYMSPEQSRHEQFLTSASDVFSLGAVLFEALTGEQYRTLRPGTRATELRGDVPAWLDELIGRMLASAPEARPFGGQELVQILEAKIHESEALQRAESHRQRAAELSNEAKRHMVEQNWMAALTSLRAWLALEPNPEAQTMLQQTEQVLAREHRLAEMLYTAKLAMSEQRWTDAQSALRDVLAMDPANRDAAGRMATVNAKLVEIQRVRVLASRARNAVGRRRWREAQQAAAKWHALSPEDVEAKSIERAATEALAATARLTRSPSVFSRSAVVFVMLVATLFGSLRFPADAGSLAHRLPTRPDSRNRTENVTSQPSEPAIATKVESTKTPEATTPATTPTITPTQVVTTPESKAPTPTVAPPSLNIDTAFDADGRISRIGRGETYRATYSHDGKLLAVASPIGIYAYDTNSYRVVRLFSSSYKISSIAFSPDDSILVSGSDDAKTRFWRVSDGALLRELDDGAGYVRSIAFSPDGVILATGSDDKVARLWRIQDGALLRELRGHTAFINSVDFSPNGKIIVTGSEDGTARLWSAVDGVVLRVLRGHTSGVRAAAFSPDGQLVATSGGNDYTARIWRVSDGTTLHVLNESRGTVNTVAFSPEGSTLATGDAGSVAHLWRVSDGMLLRNLTGHTDSISSAAFSPDGTALVTAAGDSTVRIWRTSDGTVLRLLRGSTNRLTSTAISPDGEKIAIGSYDSTARLFRVSDGSLIRELKGHGEAVYGVTFSRDGRLLATASDDNTARIWRVSDGVLVHELAGHRNFVSSAAFSPDGTLVATGSGDNTVRIWRTADGTLVRELRGHTNFVDDVAFSSDGKMLASASEDTTARVWSVSDGALVKTIQHFAKVLRVAFSPNGESLATGSTDNSVRVWRISDWSQTRKIDALGAVLLILEQ